MKKFIAVYWTLKKWHSNHRVMEASWGKYVKDTYIPFRDFSSSWIPFVDFKNPNKETVIRVEVYEVEDLSPLDRLEWHPTFYERIDVTTIDWDKVQSYNYPLEKSSKPWYEYYNHMIEKEEGWITYYNWS